MKVFVNPADKFQTIDVVHAETGLGVYSKKSLADLQMEYGPAVMVMDQDEAWAKHTDAYKEPPRRISDGDWMDALEVLPPESWYRKGDSESFCMCEHITGNITNIYVRIGGVYFVMADDARLTHEQRVGKCANLYVEVAGTDLEKLA